MKLMLQLLIGLFCASISLKAMEAPHSGSAIIRREKEPRPKIERRASLQISGDSTTNLLSTMRLLGTAKPSDFLKKSESIEQEQQNLKNLNIKRRKHRRTIKDLYKLLCNEISPPQECDLIRYAIIQSKYIGDRQSLKDDSGKFRKPFNELDVNDAEHREVIYALQKEFMLKRPNKERALFRLYMIIKNKQNEFNSHCEKFEKFCHTTAKECLDYGDVPLTQKMLSFAYEAQKKKIESNPTLIMLHSSSDIYAKLQAITSNEKKRSAMKSTDFHMAL